MAIKDFKIFLVCMKIFHLATLPCRARKKGEKLFSHLPMPVSQWPGLPDGIFSTKNHNLDKFWRVLKWKILVYSMANLKYNKAIYYLLWSFGNIVVIWYIFSWFWYIALKKYGSPDCLFGSGQCEIKLFYNFFPQFWRRNTLRQS
jgi:hypothetical protein